MKVSKRVIKIWLLLFLPFFVFKLHQKFLEIQERKDQIANIRSRGIGRPFPIDNFIDSNGVDTKIDFSKSELTAIDFWHKNCAPCLQDMQHYTALIPGMAQKIRVFSISVNNFETWKQALNSKLPAYAVLSQTLPNWKHLALKSTLPVSANMLIPSDNVELMTRYFQSLDFPMYFIVNKKGVVVATPFTLYEYLLVDMGKQNRFLFFVTQKEAWTTDYFFMPATFIEYSGYFWVLTIILYSFPFMKKGLKTNT